jgi:hypothetical protein
MESPLLQIPPQRRMVVCGSHETKRSSATAVVENVRKNQVTLRLHALMVADDLRELSILFSELADALEKTDD